MSDEKTLRLTYPMEYQGALMFLIDPVNPERALTISEEIITDNESLLGPMWPLHAGFTTKCDGEFQIDTSWCVQCNAKGHHGHLIFQCDDGSAVLSTPIYSQAFFERYLEDLGGTDNSATFSVEERNAIRVVLNDEIQKLPKEMHPDEQALLSDSDRYKKHLRFAWLSL